MLCLFIIILGDILGLLGSKIRNALGFKSKKKTTSKPYRNQIDSKEDPKYKRAVEIANNIPIGARKGQSYGRGLPKGYYVKGGKVHRYDINKDKRIVASEKISSKNKGKWRGDANKEIGY